MQTIDSGRFQYKPVIISTKQKTNQIKKWINKRLKWKKREIRIGVLYAAHEIEYHDYLKLRFQFSTFDGSNESLKKFISFYCETFESH
jgi:hypothetical protein